MHVQVGHDLHLRRGELERVVSGVHDGCQEVQRLVRWWRTWGRRFGWFRARRRM